MVAFGKRNRIRGACLGLYAVCVLGGTGCHVHFDRHTHYHGGVKPTPAETAADNSPTLLQKAAKAAAESLTMEEQ